MVEPDLEAIAALEPDLIIASPRTQKFVDKFNEIAPTVLFQAGKDDYWTSTKANIESLASAFGETGTQKAKEELAKLDKSIQEVATKNESSDKKPLPSSSTREKWQPLVPNLVSLSCTKP